LSIHTHSNRIEIDPRELHFYTGVPYIPCLEFDHIDILRKSRRTSPLSFDRNWLSAYFRHDLLCTTLPPVSLRWIDDQMGWGLFAEKDLSSMQFIAEYTGKIRRRSKEDHKNAYCFEYLLEPGEETPYLIDAEKQGGLSRYINHSATPNLHSAYIRLDGVGHIILYTASKVAKGEELRYDYGSDYWKKRISPRP
jgi:hypothetical protein